MSVKRVSLPSVSGVAMDTGMAIALSSFPVTGPVVITGISAIGFTVINMDSVAVAVSVPSVLIDSTVSEKSASLFSTGVTVRLLKSQLLISTVFATSVATKVKLPSLSVTPSGIAEICVVRRSLPSVSTSEVLIEKAIPVSSSPVAGVVESSG